MAYWPLKARSEFTPCSNCPSWGVFDTSFMFHAAVPALVSPALSPTRGSGFGAAAAMRDTGATELLASEDVVREQPAMASAPSPKASARPEWSRGLARRVEATSGMENSSAEAE